ncbi:MAG: DUF2752 domain-containing protein [Phycisphaerales bacterium]|jgi:hypothetical protein|nr:DUF2752 domain-containing protein [Phycisphaerales bacterium]
MDSAPLVYTPQFQHPKLELGMRLIALGIAAGCAIVLGLAAWLHPSRSGVGSHEQLRLTQCQFLSHTGLPCPTCGMTTSFSWFAHGNIPASFYVQPMGMLLAVIAVITIWTGLYIAITGRPALRILKFLPRLPWVSIFLVLLVAAWGWKIWIHLHGIDGW